MLANAHLFLAGTRTGEESSAVSHHVPWAALEKWEYPVSSGVDLAREIREYFIPDFSNWKEHDSYKKAFDALVQDLKAVASSQ